MPVIFSGPVTGAAVDQDRARATACCRPVASFMKVDLPQPEGPTMAMNSPCADLQVDGLDRELALGQQLLVVGEPDVLEVDEGVAAAAAPAWPSLLRGLKMSQFGRGRQEAVVPDGVAG